jgi:CO dehydrogenase/acetyl-CoA synthase beta subunit
MPRKTKKSGAGHMSKGALKRVKNNQRTQKAFASMANAANAFTNPTNMNAFAKKQQNAKNAAQAAAKKAANNAAQAAAKKAENNAARNAANNSKAEINKAANGLRIAIKNAQTVINKITLSTQPSSP